MKILYGIQCTGKKALQSNIDLPRNGRSKSARWWLQQVCHMLAAATILNVCCKSARWWLQRVWNHCCQTWICHVMAAASPPGGGCSKCATVGSGESPPRDEMWRVASDFSPMPAGPVPLALVFCGTAT